MSDGHKHHRTRCDPFGLAIHGDVKLAGAEHYHLLMHVLVRRMRLRPRPQFGDVHLHLVTEWVSPLSTAAADIRAVRFGNQIAEYAYTLAGSFSLGRRVRRRPWLPARAAISLDRGESRSQIFSSTKFTTGIAASAAGRFGGGNADSSSRRAEERRKERRVLSYGFSPPLLRVSAMKTQSTDRAGAASGLPIPVCSLCGKYRSRWLSSRRFSGHKISNQISTPAWSGA